MSNRLRASMRASNKGRSLRPRTSSSRNSVAPSDSAPPTSAEQDEVTGRLSEPEPEQPEQPEVSDETKPSAVPPPLTPARGTPAEVLAAGEAFSDDEDEDDAEAPSAQSALPVTVRESTRPIARFEAPAKKPEEPKKAEPVVIKKAEEPKKAEPVAPAKKVEPVAAKKVEEPKRAEPVAPAKKVEPVASKKGEAPVSSKKGEPIKTAARKVDESAAALRADRSAHDEESRSINGKKKGAKGEGAKRPATGEEVDDSSISAEFFRREGDSLPPLVGAHEEHEEHEEHDEHGDLVLSPAAIARQARLRRIVAGVVAFAGVITLAVVGKTLAAGKPPASSPTGKPPVVQEAKVDPKPEEKPAPAPEKKAVEAPKPSAEVAKAEPDPKADAKAVEDAKKAEEPKKPEPSGGDAKALTKEAESLLNRGKNKDAMAKAREAIAADPSEAMAYLLLGSALQDSGKWKDGIEAYSECVRNATKGPVSECRQMGGHK